MTVRLPIVSRERLLVLIQQRLRREDIAETLGVSRGTVDRWLKHHKLGTKAVQGPKRIELPLDEVRAMAAAGMWRPEIARHFKCSAKTLGKIMIAEGIVTTPKPPIRPRGPVESRPVERTGPSKSALRVANPFGDHY